MPIATPTDNLFSRCLPAIGTNIESCGAVTACDAKVVTSGDLASIYGSNDTNYRILGNLIAADFVGKAVGVRQNGLYDFLQANKRVMGGKRLSVQQVAGGVWELSPFIKMGRKRQVNSEYWTARVVAATGATPSQTADLDLKIYSQSSIPADSRWFPNGLRIFVSGKNAGAGDPAVGDTTYRLAFVVKAYVSSGSDGNGAFVRITVTPQNAGSVFAAAGNAAATQAKAKIPASLAADALLGLVVRGTPNVSDYESHCAEIPGINNNQLLPFWIETTRYSICEDELTQKYLSALRDSNPFFKQFGDVETVELNRQIIEDFQRRHANSFFFNKPLNANQTLANYNNLPAINVAAGSLNLAVDGRCIGRKANATGIYEQLGECGRVYDMEADTLDLNKLFNTLYRLQREREAAGTKADIIELFTDSFYANQFIIGMVNYFKAKYGSDVFRLTMQLNQGGEQGPFGFRFYRFTLDYPQVELRIVTHRMFDDMLAAHKAAGFETAGRMMWAIDWQNVYQGIIDSNSVTNKTGDLKQLAAVDDSYSCVMKVPSRTTKLTSTTYTAVLEAETTSFVLENLGPAAPIGNSTNNGSYYV
jgi:hypothetical protein